MGYFLKTCCKMCHLEFCKHDEVLQFTLGEYYFFYFFLICSPDFFRPVPTNSVKFELPQNTEKAMLKAVYQKMLYPDILMIVQGRKFPAHKGILAARCQVFEDMFASIEIILNKIDVV